MLLADVARCEADAALELLRQVEELTWGEGEIAHEITQASQNCGQICELILHSMETRRVFRAAGQAAAGGDSAARRVCSQAALLKLQEWRPQAVGRRVTHRRR